jgi:hypothetical protein
MSKTRGKSLINFQWQIAAGVTLGLLVLFVAFAGIAYNTINQSTQAALRERQAIAALSAEAVDNLMLHVAEQMEGSASLAARW